MRKTGTRGRWHIAVVVPARDESRTIAACLEALTASRRAIPRAVTCGITVVSDASTDGTAHIARHMLDGRYDQVLDVELSCVGASRRLGAGAAIARSPLPPERTWIASTDADTLVPRTWVDQHRRFAGGGIEAVAGVVDLIPDEFGDPLVTSRFAAAYELAADGTHGHVHGANMGFRADRYLESGGWRPLTVGEDHDLWHRLTVRSISMSSTALIVSTSARRQARAPFGFAADIAALEGSVA